MEFSASVYSAEGPGFEAGSFPIALCRSKRTQLFIIQMEFPQDHALPAKSNGILDDRKQLCLSSVASMKHGDLRRSPTKGLTSGENRTK